MSLLVKIGVPAVAGISIFAGFGSIWAMKVYNRHQGTLSEHWNDHIERDHEPLQSVVPGLWQVPAAYLTVNKYRNMTIYQLPSGNLMLHAPVALPETIMSEIEAIGQPSLLVIPNESKSSRVDVNVYKKRYPDAKVICPESIAPKLKEFVELDGTVEDELKPEESGIVLINPPLKELKEQIMDVPLQNGQRALLFGELLWNLKFFKGLLGKLFVITNMAGDGIQPQLSLVQQSFGFTNPSDRVTFLNNLAEYTKGDIPGTEKDLEPVPRYGALVFQHGNPVKTGVYKKLNKIATNL